MKRIYQKAVPIDLDDGSFSVALDNRPLKTPAKKAFALPSQALAEAVATEWDAQEEKIEPSTMPMMTLSSTTIDRVVPQFDDVAQSISAYGASDLLCYRADDNQPDLQAKQHDHWQPWLDWAMRDLDAPLKITQGIIHVEQHQASLDSLTRLVLALDAFELAALHEFTSISGSLILGLATVRKEIPAAEALEISQLDELHQAELWGDDDEAINVRQRKQAEMINAETFLDLVRA